MKRTMDPTNLEDLDVGSMEGVNISEIATENTADVKPGCI